MFTQETVHTIFSQSFSMNNDLNADIFVYLEDADQVTNFYLHDWEYSEVITSNQEVTKLLIPSTSPDRLWLTMIVATIFDIAAETLKIE